MRPFKEHRRHGEAPKSADAPIPSDAVPTEADIPKLKEEERERRGAGVPWYTGSGGGPSGAMLGSGGVRVGASMMQPGLLGSARIAAALSKFMGGSGTLVGGLFASKMGSLIVLGGMVAWGGLMAAAAVKLLGGMGAPRTLSGPVALSGAGTSGIVIDAPKDRSLGYLANANEGELQWEQGKDGTKDAAKPKEEPPPEPEAQPEQPKVEMPDVGKLLAGKGELTRENFLQKLTQDPGSLHAGGLKNGTAGFNPAKTFSNMNVPKTELGRAKAIRRTPKALRAGHRSTLRAASDRAMGQLKFAKNMSGYGAKASPDNQAKQYSTDAFEQGKTIGGQMAGVDGAGVVVPPGDGAPGISESMPDVPPGTNVTPYQQNVDTAQALDNSSAGLQMAGMMMIMMGIMMIMAGIALLNCTTFPIGWALIGAGTAMLIMGIMMLAMSGQQADAANDQGKQIDEQYGQKDQSSTINDCSDQARGAGLKSDECMSADGIISKQKATANDLHEPTTTAGESTYHMY